MNEIRITKSENRLTGKVSFNVRIREAREHPVAYHEKFNTVEMSGQNVDTEKGKEINTDAIQEMIAKLANDEQPNTRNYESKINRTLQIDHIRRVQYPQLLKVAEENGYKTGWAFYAIKEKYDYEIASAACGE